MRIVILMLSMFLLTELHAQSSPKRALFCSPGVSVGYTFGARMNFGFFVDAGIIQQAKNFEWRYGLSFNQYYVKTKRHIHRLRSFSVMAQTDFVDVKLGIGRARNKWGAGNRCITRGLSFDISFAYPHPHSPWIGFRHFIYPSSTWAWFLTPYNSLYLKYKYDIIQNTGLKETVKFN